MSQQSFVTAPDISESMQDISTPQNSSLNPNFTAQDPTTSEESNPLFLAPPPHLSFRPQSSRFSEDFSSSESTHHTSHHNLRSMLPTFINPHSNPNNPGDTEWQEDKSDTAALTPQPIHYRSMTWLHCSLIMIAETISLGILALPSVLGTVGLIPGLILILGMGALAWYSGLLIHRFRTAYPAIISWADASFASIATAVIITMISVGVRAPAEKTYSLWPQKDLTLREAFLSTTNVVFAYAGHIAFFTFISELRAPADFPKSLATLQIIEIFLYLLSSILIYIYTGSSISSPALLSAGPLVSRIAFGIAIPTIVIAGVIFGHVCAKYIFLRLFAGTTHAATRTKRGLAAWLAITAGVWVVAWIVGESVPGFNELLGLVSSLFASWFTYGLPGVMGLWLQWGGEDRRGGKWWGMLLINGLLVGVGALLCGMGVWASGVGIKETSEKGGSWSCG
ncbi:putative amino acid protein [Botrytis cinerea BcDW1]|uniref:Putative amino acid protein n=1 Tax=Botryotinia fuckeliana (strain BcDW1) TaxID=1290391 RepID=M7TMJ8_BOTF1|nr:putative amino acid protein [Botrytis cinerea BcDW1]